MDKRREQAFKIEIRKLLKEADRNDLLVNCLKKPLNEDYDAESFVKRVIELYPEKKERAVASTTCCMDKSRRDDN